MGIHSELLPYRKPRIKNGRLIDPHVVIIGAGASIAACRYDKNGVEVPVLKNIHKVLGLENVMNEYGFTAYNVDDFEKFYSSIVKEPKYRELAICLEQRVKEYFKKLEIPDEPTTYDYLVLSLTEKDAIISFNWDPFLVQTYKCNINVGNLPVMLFPHGNVGVGLCEECKTMGYSDTLCTECNKEYKDMPLLFPVGQKDYGKYSVIKYQWNEARKYLSNAAGITVFGYSAPETDEDAFELMKKAYSRSGMKEIALFEIINLEAVKEEQTFKWQDLFDKKMCVYSDTFEGTQLWRFPRVSLEALFDAILQQHPREENNGYRKFRTLKELQEFVKSIKEFEMYSGTNYFRET